MKKIIIAACAALLLTGCGVGSYSISSGKADEAAISFVDTSKHNIEVTIDDNTYNVQTVKEKAWKTDRKIKPTAQNTLRIAPGQHKVTVKADGKEVYTKNIFVSASEHKVVEL